LCCNVFSLALSLFAPQNDDEDDDDEDGDDAEELLGKGARSAALLADRTRVSVAAPRGQITALIWHLDRVSVTKCECFCALPATWEGKYSLFLLSLIGLSALVVKKSI